MSEDVAAELRRLREQVDALQERVMPDRPLDVRDLRARGYARHEAYALLHRHGVRTAVGKRYRISPHVLARIEAGEVPA